VGEVNDREKQSLPGQCRCAVVSHQLA
jgi:hypothetical protein